MHSCAVKAAADNSLLATLVFGFMRKLFAVIKELLNVPSSNLKLRYRSEVSNSAESQKHIKFPFLVGTFPLI